MSLLISLNPNNLSTYFKSSKPIVDLVDNSRLYKPVALKPPKPIRVANPDVIKTGLSKSAARRMKKAINWLTYCSKLRTKRLPSGRVVKNFGVSFVTLTLPTIQIHSHKAIKSIVLNNFLTLLRTKCDVHNYVWKAELQSNGNIHFHLTTDVFIHYMKIRTLWNQSLELLGYVSRYQTKMANMSFEDYKTLRLSTGNPKLESIRKGYNYGQKTQWSQPNSTDVHSVKDINNLAAYMAKYLVKPLVKTDSTKACKDSAKTFKGRIWFCSQSLSRLGNVSVSINDVSSRILRFLRSSSKVSVFSNDFVTSYFFQIKLLPKHIRNWFRECLLSHAILNDYPFPSTLPNL